MDLKCTESIATNNLAKIDPHLYQDVRVVENLLNEEHSFVPSCNYFEETQTDIEPYMRKVVTTWMLEVSE